MLGSKANLLMLLVPVLCLAEFIDKAQKFGQLMLL